MPVLKSARRGIRIPLAPIASAQPPLWVVMAHDLSAPPRDASPAQERLPTAVPRFTRARMTDRMAGPADDAPSLHSPCAQRRSNNNAPILQNRCHHVFAPNDCRGDRLVRLFLQAKGACLSTFPIYPYARTNHPKHPLPYSRNVEFWAL